MNWNTGEVTGLTSVDLYHGDSQGGARNLFSIGRHDIDGFYATPHLNYALMFTCEYATVAGGEVTTHRLEPGVRVVSEDFLTDAIDWQESAGLGTLPYHTAVAERAKLLGFDAIHRQRADYRERGRWRRGHEVIVLDDGLTPFIYKVQSPK